MRKPISTVEKSLNSPEMLHNRLPATGVGLSDPTQSKGRRKMLDLINRLHSTGVQLDLDLPMIAVIGSQSAGKSSLIESISGITLPRASGTCTRCPTECRLSFSETPWKCNVNLSFTIGPDGQPLASPQNIPFGDTIYIKADVEERIRRAQQAILNPRIDPTRFLIEDEDDFDRSDSNKLSFSTNSVSLQISGPDLSDLSFCDLPGLIASVGKQGNVSDIELVKGLITTYISKPSCLILLTVACETDFENQGAHNLAKLFDPEGKRTIGVLTKPDRIPTGEEDRWLRFIRNEEESLDNGWFSVKQPDSKTIASGISWGEAREQESVFFSSKMPWSSLDPSYQRKLGTQNLTECLSHILSDLIKRRLPQLQQEIQNLLHKTNKSLEDLPRPPPDDPVSEIIHLVTLFARDLSSCIEGSPDPDGLIQTIRPLQDHFRRNIRSTAPDFRPYPRIPEREDFPPPSFLSNEEQPTEIQSSRDPIYIDEVMRLAMNAKSRELPDHIPFIVSKRLINDVTMQWKQPALDFFEEVFHVFTNKFVDEQISAHFGQYHHGGLHNRISVIVHDVLDKCHDTALEYIHWLLRAEHEVFTLNEHYFSDYKDKFLAYYRSSRQEDQNSPLMNMLDQPTVQTGGGMTPLSYVMTGLSQMGLHGVKPTDIPKLLPSDPYEPALQIMAGVRAYFQVAYKRFSDYIPIAIDQELIRGLDWNHGIEAALLKGLEIGGPESIERSRELLQEHPSVMARREDLENRRVRLESARKQLLMLLY